MCYGTENDKIQTRKKALLLCASHNDLGLLKALKKLGYYIIVTGKIPNQPGEKYADKYIPLDYSDKEAVLQLAREEKVDAICQCCNDFGVYTAAYVAEKMGLPGYDSYENTLMLHNKDRFKKFASKYGIVTPEASYFESKEEAVKWSKGADYPIIVKPVDASAGNGISKIETAQEAVEAIEYAFSKSKAGRVVMEPFINGSQHGFCTFLLNKKVVAYCSNNEYSFLNPYRVEIDTYPADNCEQVKHILIEQIEKIAEILDLKDGIFHLQYIMNEKGPQIIEVMRRVLGNMYSVPASLLNGIDWDYWEIRARSGLDCSHFPVYAIQEGFYAYKTVLASANGKIKDIVIPSKYEKYLIYQFFIKKAGDRITNYMSEPVGFLFFMFSSQEEMKNVLIEDYIDTMVLMNN